MRLDKYLAETAQCTRSEAKALLAKGRVTVNGAVCRKGDTQLKEADAVAVDGNAADVLGVDVARDVAPLVDYKHALALFLRHLRERRAEQPRADDEIIILHILILLVDDTFR